jgi:hypothetical protein
MVVPRLSFLTWAGLFDPSHKRELRVFATLDKKFSSPFKEDKGNFGSKGLSLHSNSYHVKLLEHSSD